MGRWKWRPSDRLWEGSGTDTGKILEKISVKIESVCFRQLVTFLENLQQRNLLLARQ